MAGRGFISEALPVDTSHIQVLRNGRFWPFFRPVNPDRATACVCLAESFAEAYSKKYGVEVGLIPCADNLHFSSKSLYDFGLRYFEEFERLRNPDKIFCEKPVGDLAVRTDMEAL